MNTLLVNALSAKRGGALVVHIAILSNLVLCKDSWNVKVVTNSETAAGEFRKFLSSDVEIIQVPGIFTSLSTVFQPLFMRWYSRTLNAGLIFNQNYFLASQKLPQMVYHVNVFNFLDNEALVGMLAGLKQKLKKLASRRAVLKASCNVYESEYLLALAADVVGQESRENASVIYIGVEQSNADGASAAQIHQGKASNRIVIVTSDNAHKRNALSVETIKQLASLDPRKSWEVCVFGTFETADNVYATLQESTGDLHQNINMDIRGYASQQTIREVLDTSLCLLCTSKIESFCTVAVEAMARGVPAIVTGESSMPESVGWAGYVDAESSSISMAEEIYKLHVNDEYRAQRQRKSLDYARGLTWESAGEDFTRLIEKYS